MTRGSRTLGGRWALRFGLVAAVTLAALFAFVEDRVDRLVRGGAEEMLELLLEHARAQPGSGSDSSHVAAALHAANPDEKVAFVFYDAGGERVRALGHPRSRKAPPPPPGLPVGASLFRELDLGSRYPYWSLARREAGGSAVQVVLYARRFLRRGERMEYAFLAVLPIAAAGFGVLGFVMRRSFLVPVRRMVDSMESMGARQLQERLPLSGSDDELDRIALSFNRLMARLEQSFQTLRGFTGDVAHQLRGPLTALQSRIEVTLREESWPPRTVATLEELLGDVRRMSALVDTMLRLARYSAGLEARQRQLVDLGETVAEVAEFLGPLAAERRIDLRVERSAPAEVLGDPSWLRQLLVNLLENALEHTPEAGAIRVALEDEGESVRVRVEDSGPGIPAALRDRVFERFFQVASDRASGLGLGLAIAKEIAEVHDGRLEAGAGPGGGALVTLRLPREPSKPDRRMGA